MIYALVRPFGFFCVLLCLLTWGFDALSWVEPCWYCRLQRTIVGLLGIILIIRRPHMLLEYVSLVMGSFGIYLASRQLMDNFLQGFFDRINIYFAAGSLLLIVGAVYVICHLQRIKSIN